MGTGDSEMEERGDKDEKIKKAKKLGVAAGVTMLVFVVIGVATYYQMGGVTSLWRVVLMAVAGMLLTIGMIAVCFLMHASKHRGTREATADKVIKVIADEGYGEHAERILMGFEMKIGMVVLMVVGVALAGWVIYERANYCRTEMPPSGAQMRAGVSLSEHQARQEWRWERCATATSTSRNIVLSVGLALTGLAGAGLLFRRRQSERMEAEIKSVEWRDKVEEVEWGEIGGDGVSVGSESESIAEEEVVEEEVEVVAEGDGDGGGDAHDDGL